MSEENNKISARKVMEKTITGDRKISGKRISPLEYFRVQTQNPSIGFLATLFLIVIIILAIPIFPRVAKAVEVNEQKKVAFEEKLMPRSLAIPVNMLPYLRFQHLALKNGKYATWHQPVFRSGSCDRENLVLYRGMETFILMNLYPYTNGHLMIAPYLHTSDVNELAEIANKEIMQFAKDCFNILLYNIKIVITFLII